MAKKKNDYSVLTEVNTEDEWLTLCEREGLTIVDVYSAWSGPCTAMTNYLKKVKVEVNDDLLSYAMAKTDDIPQLRIFHGHCTPIWLFLASGDPVAVVHGANAPLLGKRIHDEMVRERNVMQGNMRRRVISLNDAVPRRDSTQWSQNPIGVQLSTDADSDEIFRSLQSLTSSEVAKEAVEGQDQVEDEGSRNFALLLIEEYIADSPDGLQHVRQELDEKGLSVVKEKNLTLCQEDAVFFASGSTLELHTITPLIGTHCRTFLLRCEESLNARGLVNEMLGPVEPPPKPDEKPRKRSQTASKKVLLRQKFYDEAEFTVGFLSPDHAGFVALVDKFFMDSPRMADKARALAADVLQKCSLLVFDNSQNDEVVKKMEDEHLEVFGQSVTEMNESLVSMQPDVSSLDATNKQLSDKSLLGILVLSSVEEEVIRDLNPLLVTNDVKILQHFFPNLAKGSCPVQNPEGHDSDSHEHGSGDHDDDG